MITFDIHDAPPLEELLALVAAGEEIVLTDGGEIVARLTGAGTPRLGSGGPSSGWNGQR